MSHGPEPLQHQLFQKLTPDQIWAIQDVSSGVLQQKLSLVSLWVPGKEATPLGSHWLESERQGWSRCTRESGRWGRNSLQPSTENQPQLCSLPLQWFPGLESHKTPDILPWNPLNVLSYFTRNFHYINNKVIQWNQNEYHVIKQNISLSIYLSIYLSIWII